MTIKFSAGDEPPVDLLAEVETYYRATAEELIVAVNAIRAGRFDQVPAAAQAGTRILL